MRKSEINTVLFVVFVILVISLFFKLSYTSINSSASHDINKILVQETSVKTFINNDPSFSSVIQKNEYACTGNPCIPNSTDYQEYLSYSLVSGFSGVLYGPLGLGSGLQFNPFLPGEILSSSTPECYAILAVDYNWFHPAGYAKTIYTTFTGEFGYPQSSVPRYSKINQGVGFAMLFSEFQITGLTSNNYYVPLDNNTVRWSNAALHFYPGNFPYLYAENNSANLFVYGAPNNVVDGNTFIVPAVSCGASLQHPLFSGYQYVANLTSGFVPSVGLGSDGQVGSIAFSFVTNTPLYDILFGPYYQYSGNFPAIGSGPQWYHSDVQFTNPKINNASFPEGNNGDVQYLNNQNFFSTVINGSNYPGINLNSNFFIYESNSTILTYQTKSSKPNLTDAVEFSNLSAFSVPNLVMSYWPFTGSFYNFGAIIGPTPSVVLDTFKIDGILPVCNTGAGYHYCTFENTDSINPISTYRLWDYNLVNGYTTGSMFGGTTGKCTTTNYRTWTCTGTGISPETFYTPMDINPFTPGYNNSGINQQLNTLEIKALDSFCFYNDYFNNNTGVYNSPSYTRIIPPLPSENYTVAIGECNGLFNSTDCFNPSYGNYLNFESGIIIPKVSCTATGIEPTNVTDAWISSVSIANNAGQFCGYFGGRKSRPTINLPFLGNYISGPLLANYTTFSTIIYHCPSFSSNSSYANLLITVKNVGNTNITSPFFYVLYNNTNPADMFYTSSNTPQSEYAVYQDFLAGMTRSTGVMQLRFSNNGKTDLFYSMPGNPMQDIPIAQLFSEDQDYLNGPYNNSLLGMWIDYNGKIIRTANTFLSYANSSNSGLPIISPNGTASFTVEVPISVLKHLLLGKVKIAVYFGDMFNVNWFDHTVGSPYVQSGDSNSTQIHNMEYLDPSSSYPMPIWQYLAGYSFNISNSVFDSVSILNSNLNIMVTGDVNNVNGLNVTVSASINKTNGTGLFNLNTTGSSISCFATQDNMNDFDVLWDIQAASPSNLNFLLKNFYGTNQYQNEVINRWRGLIFMPYASNVVLNYNNLPYYPTDTASFSVEEPIINATQSITHKTAFVLLQQGPESTQFSTLSNAYSILNESNFNISSMYYLSNQSFGFTPSVKSVRGNPSEFNIGSYKQLYNGSTFSDNSVTISGPCLSGTYVTDLYGVVNISTSSMNSCKGSYIQITSNSGPFLVTMYNNTPLNLTNEFDHGTFPIVGNFSSLIKNANGYYTASIYINSSSVFNGDGVSFQFKYLPLTKVNKNIDIYLYYINGTPFSGCSSGLIPSGNETCQINSPFTSYIRAVFVNNSNDEYLGGIDIGSGLMAQYFSGSSNIIMLTYNGEPVNSQSANLTEYTEQNGQLQTSTCFTGSITNGIMNLSAQNCNLQQGGNYSLSVDAIVDGNIEPLSLNIIDAQLSTSNHIIGMSLSTYQDNPNQLQNITMPNPSSSIPVFFSLPSSDVPSCNDIKIIANYNEYTYPYQEMPYQVIQNIGGSCFYVFIAKNSQTYNKLTFEVFMGSTPAPSYPSNWGKITNNVYYYSIQANNYSATLLPNCKPGLGPCLYNVSAFGENIGSLLVNNVSAQVSAIQPQFNQPVMDCVSILFTSTYSFAKPISGFGTLNYNLNRLYELSSPSQQIVSSYCFFDGSNVITDSISAVGEPVPFNIEDELNPTFTSAYLSNGNSIKLPNPIQTQCSSYSSVNETITTERIVSGSGQGLLLNCVNSSSNIKPNINIKNVTLGPSYFSSDASQFYCLAQTYPTYTTEVSPIYSNGTSNEDYGNYNDNQSNYISFLYYPGNYSAKNGSESLIFYDTCIPPNVSRSYTLNELNPPKFFIGSSIAQTYDGSQGENYLEHHTAINGSQFSSSSNTEILYNPNGGVLIDKCPVNTSINLYTPCIKAVGSSGFYPTNAYSGGLEGIPYYPKVGESPSVFSYNYPIGGGCLVDTTNPSQAYYCAPTYGLISSSYGGFKSSWYSAATSVSYTGSLNYIWSNNAYLPSNTGITSDSFSCSGSANVSESGSITYYEYNTSTGKVINPDAGSCPLYAYQLEYVYCSNTNGVSSGNTCYTTFSEGNFNTAVNNPNTPVTIHPTSSCYLNESTTSYTTWSISPSCTLPSGNSTAEYAYAYNYSTYSVSVSGVQPYELQINGPTHISLNQGEPTFYNSLDYSDSCQNESFNGYYPIQYDTQNGWDWSPYWSYQYNVPTTNPNGIPLVGGCEANRDTYNLTSPNITYVNTANGIQGTYSCPSGYSGSILSCENITASPQASFTGSIFNSSCTVSSYYLNQSSYSTYTNSPAYGASCLSCSSLPSNVNPNNYQQPNPNEQCIAFPISKFNSTYASYVLQYSNTYNLGVGLGVLNGNYQLNISMPGDTLSSNKDLYMTSLSESQNEFTDIFMQLYPSMLFEHATLGGAMATSYLFPFDLLDTYLLQNPYFGVSGIASFINGSVYDYAMNIFTGGTQNNCISSQYNGNYGLYSIGEGMLCSGNQLPSKYVSGIFLSLGSLNEGIHSIQFYSVGTRNSAPPSVNIYSSRGEAISLDSTCGNGNQRAFTYTYNGGSESFQISSDDECQPINNLLYGYIVNCIYQTPGNQTYTVNSQYYLAYDLPTIWKVSYTLLVSPKSYDIVPVPVNTITSSSGSYLSIIPSSQQNRPMGSTTFVESGLPSGAAWSVTYDGITKSSTSQNIVFTVPIGSYYFTVPEVYYNGVYYTPSPVYGSLSTGNQEVIYFTLSSSGPHPV